MKLTHSASAWAARLGMAVLAFATPLGAQNLVENPGFETGDLSFWTQARNTGGTSVSSGSNWNLDDLGVVPEPPVVLVTPGLVGVVVPEPTSIVLLGTGLVGLAGLLRRRRKTF